MPRVRPVDLRQNVLAAVASGATHRQAAARFGVSPASVSRWRQLAREQGDARPAKQGGDRRSGRIEAQRGVILTLLAEMEDASIATLRDALGARGHWFGYGSWRRFFLRHGIARGKAATTPPPPEGDA